MDPESDNQELSNLDPALKERIKHLKPPLREAVTRRLGRREGNYGRLYREQRFLDDLGHFEFISRIATAIETVYPRLAGRALESRLNRNHFVSTVVREAGLGRADRGDAES